MKAKLVLFAALGLFFATAAVLGFSDNVAVGPFSVSFTINTTDQPDINLSEPEVTTEFTKYGFKLKTDAKRQNLINFLVYDYRNSTDTSENKPMDLITNRVEGQSYKIEWDRMTVENLTAQRAKIRSSGESSYVIAYSPDGKKNMGQVIVLVESFASPTVTDSFLENLQVIRSE